MCRLACSLYDYFVDGLTDAEIEKDPMAKFVNNMCIDQKGKNIMYKKNGRERYPDFKLYKMISRCVNNQLPERFIPFFSKFICSKKKISNKARIFDLDSLPSYK